MSADMRVIFLHNIQELRIHFFEILMRYMLSFM